jgi:hypothetical protein
MLGAHRKILARDPERDVLAGTARIGLIVFHTALIGQRKRTLREIMELAVIPRTLFIAMLALALGFAQRPQAQPPASTPRQQPTPKITDAIVQKGAAEPGTTEDEPEYMCPMDKDVRSTTPGTCSKCGMTLVLNLPEPREYPVRLTMKPPVPKVGEVDQLHFRIEDPTNHKQVQDYEIMHEKLYHLFVVSQDTTFFNHVHPEKQPDGSFILNQKFPKPGLYRILSDFYPKGGTPQLVSTAVMVPGEGFKIEPAKLKADIAPQEGKNLKVELVTDPPEPLAGFKTMMFFRLTPNKDIEMYLGARGHMLAASSDLIDMMHTHPFLETDSDEGGYKQVQFNLIFPRAGIYRVWVQFQRAGVLNTIAFNVPVKNLE